MTVPPGIAAQQALTQQNIALAVIRQATEADRQLVNILDNALRNVPKSSRGSTVNLRA